MKLAVILYGPPGSGKGTQASLAADKLDLIHFDTGRYLRSYLYDPKNKKLAVVRRERKIYEAGRLTTPSFVTGIVMKGVRDIAKAGYGVVFSGSPRTLYEAERLAPFLAKLYGKTNVLVFRLIVSRETSLHRNSHRVLCECCNMTVLRTLLPSLDHLRFCPFCGAKFKKRTDDEPEIIKRRIREYEERTGPVLSYMKRHGYRLHEIKGETVPYKVHAEILRRIKC